MAHYLLAAEVTQKELHLGIVETLPHVKYIDGVASCQQLLYHVLSQEPRASDHCALPGLWRERGGKGHWCDENCNLYRAWSHMSSANRMTGPFLCLKPTLAGVAQWIECGLQTKGSPV